MIFDNSNYPIKKMKLIHNTLLSNNNNIHMNGGYKNRKRTNSSIYSLRLFHNWIKNKLISDSKLYFQNLNNDNPKLLDLAVGRGGDLYKWKNNNIKTVVGFDIDNDSINGNNGAKSRYNKLRDKDNYNYSFYVMDLYKENSLDQIKKITDNIYPFDIVSCQFAIHYFFKSETILDNFIKIVSNMLDKDGIFIGTTLDGNKIKNLLSKNNGHLDLPLVGLKEIDFHNDSTYSQTYLMRLGDKTDVDHYFNKVKPEGSIEYLVDLDELVKVCKKYSLEPIQISSFENMYELYKQSNKFKNLSNDEMLPSFLNFLFIFKKI